MIRWFKRRRPAIVQPASSIGHYDAITAYCWGLTLAEWDRLPALVKADKRENIVNAPRFQP